MGLVRVLENAIPLQRKRPELPADVKNVCGSASAHFRPSPTGKLSVFAAQNLDFEKRIALAMALSRKQVDDVVYCVLPDQVIEELECQLEENAGALSLADVNEAHRDLVGVTLFCVASLAVKGVESGVIKIDGKDLVLTILKGIDEGQLSVDMMKEKLWESIQQTRAYKTYRKKAPSARG